MGSGRNSSDRRGDRVCRVNDQDKLSRIKQLLSNVIKGSKKSRGAKTIISHGVTHADWRLHQMMFQDRDYERVDDDDDVSGQKQRPNVNIVNWHDKDYSMVTMESKDQSKLLFDTVCTLTDMQYVIFHANIDTKGLEAYQEYYIRRVDGFPVKSDAERQSMIQCLEAAIERRVSEIEARTIHDRQSGASIRLHPDLLGEQPQCDEQK